MWKRRLLTLPVALLTLSLLGGAEGFDADELACEAAVAHLAKCCPPGSRALSLDCSVGRGCDNRVPDLTSQQSNAFVGESCAELLDSGACDTAPQPQPSQPGLPE